MPDGRPTSSPPVHRHRLASHVQTTQPAVRRRRVLQRPTPTGGATLLLRLPSSGAPSGRCPDRRSHQRVRPPALRLRDDLPLALTHAPADCPIVGLPVAVLSSWRVLLHLHRRFRQTTLLLVLCQHVAHRLRPLHVAPCSSPVALSHLIQLWSDALGRCLRLLPRRITLPLGRCQHVARRRQLLRAVLRSSAYGRLALAPGACRHP